MEHVKQNKRKVFQLRSFIKEKNELFFSVAQHVGVAETIKVMLHPAAQLSHPTFRPHLPQFTKASEVALRWDSHYLASHK